MGLGPSLGEDSKGGSLEKHQTSVMWGLLFTGMMFCRHKMDLRSGSGGGGELIDRSGEGWESARRIDGAKVKVRATNGWPCPG